MKKSIIEKIKKTLEILTVPATAVVAVWTTDVAISAYVAGGFGLAGSILSYLELFCKAE